MFALVGVITVEEDGLHIFATDFADESHGGMKFFDGRRDRHDFLNDFPANEGSDKSGAGSGEINAV